MSKRCVFVAMSSQKGGVGKSTMTVLLAGYFHYVMGYNVAVVDCDYPQFSIKALRSRDTQNVEKNVNLQRMLCGQFDRTGKKAYPVLTSVPGKELKTALPLTGGCDILFFDLPGTVNSPGVIKTIVNMDYVFTPIIQDRMVMQSSLSFLLALKDFTAESGHALEGNPYVLEPDGRACIQKAVLSVRTSFQGTGIEGSRYGHTGYGALWQGNLPRGADPFQKYAFPSFREIAERQRS